MVITSNNPVYAVLWLIFAFCNSAGLMVLIGAQFIAMMLIIIYVGAVAVLFLFVVMMLNVKLSTLKAQMSKASYFSIFMTLVLFVDLVLIVLLSAGGAQNKILSEFTLSAEVNNAAAIGRVLYTEFVLPFELSGIILFAAMVASIALTHRSRGGVKKQNPYKQLQRSKLNSLAIATNNGKEGLKDLNYDN